MNYQIETLNGQTYYNFTSRGTDYCVYQSKDQSVTVMSSRGGDRRKFSQVRFFHNVRAFAKENKTFNSVAALLFSDAQGRG